MCECRSINYARSTSLHSFNGASGGEPCNISMSWVKSPKWNWKLAVIYSWVSRGTTLQGWRLACWKPDSEIGQIGYSGFWLMTCSAWWLHVHLLKALFGMNICAYVISLKMCLKMAGSTLVRENQMCLIFQGFFYPPDSHRSTGPWCSNLGYQHHFRTF